MLVANIAALGYWLLDVLEGLGRFASFCGSTWAWFFRGVRSWARPGQIMPQFYYIGTRSIGVVVVVGTFIGMVLAIEAYDQFAAIGQQARLGGIISVSVVKQVGPVLAAIMIAGRVGGSVSAELGTMRVTEQLDALRVMGADPVPHLVLPRLVACVIMVPLLTVFSDLMGIFGGWVITVKGFGVNPTDYWEFSARFVEAYDVYVGLIKAVFFGLAIGLISCYKGFFCTSGAAGVGRAATQAFVTSFLVIVVMNFFLAKFLKDFYVLLFGYSSVSAFSG